MVLLPIEAYEVVESYFKDENFRESFQLENPEMVKELTRLEIPDRIGWKDVDETNFRNWLDLIDLNSLSRFL